MPNNISSYGFFDLAQLASQRIITINVETINTAVSLSLAEHTRQINELMSSLVTRTVDYKRRYQLASAGTLQPLDAKGIPLPVVPSGIYDIAFPIQGAGTAWGNDRISRALMTVADADRATMDAMDRDTDWMRRHIMAALFTNVTWTQTDERYGALVVQPLANNDAVTYVKRGGTAVADQHFFAQAAAISDAANPFPTLYSALNEHPGNTGPFVAYVASSLVAGVQSLTALNTNVNSEIAYGANANIPRAVLVPVDYSSNGFPPSIVHFGDRYLGYVSGMHIVEWAALPAGYIIAHATGVPDVVGMREYEAAELQGLFPEFHDRNGTLYEYRFIRFAGFGIMNRIGAAVMQIGSGSYSVPTGFLAPLAS